MFVHVWLRWSTVETHCESTFTVVMLNTRRKLPKRSSPSSEIFVESTELLCHCWKLWINSYLAVASENCPSSKGRFFVCMPISDSCILSPYHISLTSWWQVMLCLRQFLHYNNLKWSTSCIVECQKYAWLSSHVKHISELSLPVTCCVKLRQWCLAFSVAFVLISYL